jgi:thiamine kinase-like enzyme
MKVYNKGYMNNNFIDENLFIKKAKAIAINYLGFENMQQGLEVIFHSSENKNILKPIEINFTDGITSTYPYFDEAKNILPREFKNYFNDIIKIIEDVHKIKNENLKPFDANNKINFFLKNIKNKINDYDKYLEQVQNNIFVIEKKYKSVVCHNDLNENNFIELNNEIILIDFDTVSSNTKIFDYASFITETLGLNNLDDDIEIFILTLREKNILSDDEINDLREMINCQYFLWSLWANYFYEFEENNLFKQISQKMFCRIK